MHRLKTRSGHGRVANAWHGISTACLLVGVVLSTVPEPTLAQNPGVAGQNAATIRVSARVESPEIGRATHEAERYADSLVAWFGPSDRLDAIDMDRSGVRIVGTLLEPQTLLADDRKRSSVAQQWLRVSLIFTAN